MKRFRKACSQWINRLGPVARERILGHDSYVWFLLGRLAMLAAVVPAALFLADAAVAADEGRGWLVQLLLGVGWLLAATALALWVIRLLDARNRRRASEQDSGT